ncbi:MAG: hypothetical protein COW00_15010 [Bdellovibrio sp. CG12_big_fil_rev_8_21_14_0_65_39_13]|nr:MAG: hypothetical protein COW78_00565 [Bdellovibrio sp. CG22_combo_CG10-13_8_21_14_all_39_27]PIQ58601.1 MAG: hypothetical protein COW00_15010 [Bdellovibrio sp. CG12_big_fil_rev_8_21_14_0_65_39_13]PIR33809.1 MAG: hypothetical protein COV37_14970 [Bdellovibrio sp. CG11_big_fil_rev_8_21_14_0_20_39_38]
MNLLRTQILFLLLVIMISPQLLAQDQNREMQELEELSQEVQIFKSGRLESKGAIVITKAEEDWMTDELSTGAAAAPIRESDQLLNPTNPLPAVESNEFVPQFPLAPEEKSAPRRRSR